MEFWVYMLECADGALYLGHTNDLARGVAEHQAGVAPGYTSLRRPVRLLWSQEFPSRDEAFVRERQLKGWTRAKSSPSQQATGGWSRRSRGGAGADASGPFDSVRAAPGLRSG